MDGGQDVLNCNVGFPMREVGVCGDIEQPREIAHTKSQSGQWWVRGGRRKDGWREVWVGLGGNVTHVVLEVGRNECGVKVYARGGR